MDYEKKLEEAKRLYKSATADQKYVLESLFPELKESEDEKLRKDLLQIAKESEDSFYMVMTPDKREQLIAWLEKQGEKSSVIRWYDVSLIPQEMKELLVEWDSEDATWHEIAFYHTDTKTFWNGTRQVENVTRWCYITDLLEKQGKQKSQRMISAEAKEAMYDKPANTVKQKCEESKTKIFDAPTPFEDKLYAFVAACEFLAIPSKIEFILEHSQEILDAAREQIGKEQKPAWSEEDEIGWTNTMIMIKEVASNHYTKGSIKLVIDWLKSIKQRIEG